MSLVAFVVVDGTNKTCSVCHRAPVNLGNTSNRLYEHSGTKELQCIHCLKTELAGAHVGVARYQSNRARSSVAELRAVTDLLVQRPASSVCLPRRRDAAEQKPMDMVPSADSVGRDVLNGCNDSSAESPNVHDRPRKDIKRPRH